MRENKKKNHSNNNQQLFCGEGKTKENHNNSNQYNCIADYEQSVRINSSDIVYKCNRNAKSVHIITNAI